MMEYQRKYSEIKALAILEPGLRNIFVEGNDDRFLIENFLGYTKKTDVGVYSIDSVDLSEKFGDYNEETRALLYRNNKEQVVFLASLLESEISTSLPILCIVDIDFDYVNDNVRIGHYLTYTDFNSMENYLFESSIIQKFLHQGLRIMSFQIEPLLKSLSVLCRQVFHIRHIVNQFSKSLIDNDKDFQFDSATFKCSLLFDSYWEKTMNKCGLISHSKELLIDYYSSLAHQCDERMEIRGHDFIHYLYLCVKRIKSGHLCMSETEFGNVFWQYIDLDSLCDYPLFKRILAL